MLLGLLAEGVQIDRHCTSLFMLLHQGLWYVDRKVRLDEPSTALMLQDSGDGE